MSAEIKTISDCLLMRLVRVPIFCQSSKKIKPSGRRGCRADRADVVTTTYSVSEDVEVGRGGSTARTSAMAPNPTLPRKREREQKVLDHAD